MDANRTRKPRPLTAAELEVMQVLWDHKPLKPADIQARFPRPITNMTLRSTLRVLVEKGHAKRTRRGKAYYYSARIKRGTAIRRIAQALKKRLGGGASFALIAELIKSEELSEEHLRELERIARGEGRTRISDKERKRKS